jgi:hypothetical protein
VGKPGGKTTPLGRCTRKREGNRSKGNRTGWYGLIQPAEDRDHWWVLVNTIMNLQVQ